MKNLKNGIKIIDMIAKTIDTLIGIKIPIANRIEMMNKLFLNNVKYHLKIQVFVLISPILQ